MIFGRAKTFNNSNDKYLKNNVLTTEFIDDLILYKTITPDFHCATVALEVDEKI